MKGVGPFISVGLFLLVSFGNLPFAQNAPFNTYDFESQLAKGLIKDIEPDHQGYIWTATDKGVVRFDGQKATFYKDGIKGGFTKALLKTENGRLLALHDFGLTEIYGTPDSDWFEPLLEGATEDRDDRLFYPKTIFEDRQNRIWIGENQSVVLVTEGGLKKYRIGANDNLGVLTRSFAFHEDSSGDLWCISHAGLLYYFDENEAMFIKQPLGGNITSASSMVAFGDGRVIIGGADGLYNVRLEKRELPLSIKFMGGPKGVSCLAQLKDEYFVGTWMNGLHYLSANDDFKELKKINSLPFNDIVALNHDENNGLWVAGHDHTSLLKPVYFNRIDLDTDTPPTITSLNATADGNILVISDENEVGKQSIKELKNGEIIWEWKGLANNFKNIPLAAFSDGNKIWLGDLGGRVYFIEKSNNMPVEVKNIEESNSYISDIVGDKKGSIWVAGNFRHGIIQIQHDGSIKFYKKDGLDAAKVIFLDIHGSIYVGGKGLNTYLYRYVEGIDAFENISLPINEQIKSDFEVNDILQNKSGTFYLATSHGVFIYGKSKEGIDQIKRLELGKVSVDEPTNSLALADDNTLWATTTSGLVALKGNTSFLFDKSSGLPTNSFTDHGLLMDEGNNLWVGTASGLSYHEFKGIEFPVTPSPIIKAVKINKDNWPINSLHVQKIPYNAGIEINFLSLSMPSSRVVYATRILEVDTSWSAPSAAKQSFVAGLTAGVYTFQVKAQQEEGMNWSNPASLQFRVAHPWYQRPPYILALFFGLVALVLLLARLYNWRLIQQKKYLEKIVADRTEKIERQKNEMIEQEKRMRKLEEEHYKNVLENKNKQLTTYTLNLMQKNQSLKELRLKIHQVIRSSSKTSYQEMQKLINLIDFSFRKDEDWDNFKLFFEEVHVGFFEKLVERHPKLTSHDLRHCALIRLNLTIDETATIVGISSDSIKTARFRLKRKMDLDSRDDLFEYLMTI